MSKAMSRSSRWKGALLASAAMAIVSPLAAKAQALSLGITTNPIGSGPQSNIYVDPYDAVTLYVYATVTGSSAPSATYVDGLDYAYFNVNAAITSGVAGLGTITSATPSTLFGGGNFNQTTGNPGAGAQGGAFNAATSFTSTPSIAVGNAAALGSMAKPRSAGDVYWASNASSGSNVIVIGNQVSFLVETLTYQPIAATAYANPSAPGSLNTVSFNASIPSATLFAPTTAYYGSNYFVGLPSTPSLGTSPGASNTSSAYTVSATQVNLTNALHGDATLDGTVNFSDLSEVLTHYGNTDTKWGDGNFLFGSIPADTTINFSDLSLVLTNYNSTLGPAPSIVAADAALLADPSAVALLESNGITPVAAVPEPASLALIGLLGAGTLVRRRR